jgi:hypothetical protein
VQERKEGVGAKEVPAEVGGLGRAARRDLPHQLVSARSGGLQGEETASTLPRLSEMAVGDIVRQAGGYERLSVE